MTIRKPEAGTFGRTDDAAASTRTGDAAAHEAARDAIRHDASTLDAKSFATRTDDTPIHALDATGTAVHATPADTVAPTPKPAPPEKLSVEDRIARIERYLGAQNSGFGG